MEEEKKEVLEEQPVEEQPAEEPKAEGEKKPMDPLCKNVLIAFILACVSFFVSGGWIVGGIAAVICGIIALKFLKKNEGVVPEKQPFKVFALIAKILAIVGIVLGAISIVVWGIFLIIAIVGAIISAISNAVSLVIL